MLAQYGGRTANAAGVSGQVDRNASGLDTAGLSVFLGDEHGAFDDLRLAEDLLAAQDWPAGYLGGAQQGQPLVSGAPGEGRTEFRAPLPLGLRMIARRIEEPWVFKQMRAAEHVAQGNYLLLGESSNIDVPSITTTIDAAGDQAA